MNFTDRNIPSVSTKGITVGKKKLKQSKNNDDISFIPTELPKKLIPSVKSIGKIIGKVFTSA